MEWNMLNGDFSFVEKGTEPQQVDQTENTTVPQKKKIVVEEENVATYGAIEISAEITGDLYIDNAFVKKITANKLSLKNIETGAHTIEIRGNETFTQRTTVNKDQTTYITAKSSKQAVTTTDTTTIKTTANAIGDFFAAGIAIRGIAGGTFTMGSKDGDSDEKPPHTVTVSNFAMMKTEVTFEQYDAFCEATSREKPSNQGWGRGNRPVINVSWNDAVAYAEWLSKKTGQTWRLPTEAEWEYAAKGGQETTYAGDNLDNVAWYSSNANGTTHPVQQKTANGYGLYDMSGNVWEWCADWYGTYNTGSQTNPQGASTGSLRVLRGGSWGSGATDCRVAFRSYVTPGSRDGTCGFRVVLVF